MQSWRSTNTQHITTIGSEAGLTWSTNLAVEGSNDVISDRVSVSVQQAIDVIDDIPTVVPDGEGGGGAHRRDEARGSKVSHVQFLVISLVGLLTEGTHHLLDWNLSRRRTLMSSDDTLQRRREGGVSGWGHRLGGNGIVTTLTRLGTRYLGDRVSLLSSCTSPLC